MKRLYAALLLTVVLAGDAAAQRRIDRFTTVEPAGGGETVAAMHADWRTRTTVLVAGGAVLGAAAGAISEAIECSVRVTVDAVAGDEDPECDASYGAAMLIGGLAGGLAGYLLDLLIGHPHEAAPAP